MLHIGFSFKPLPKPSALASLPRPLRQAQGPRDRPQEGTIEIGKAILRLMAGCSLFKGNGVARRGLKEQRQSLFRFLFNTFFDTQIISPVHAC